MIFLGDLEFLSFIEIKFREGKKKWEGVDFMIWLNILDIFFWVDEVGLGFRSNKYFGCFCNLVIRCSLMFLEFYLLSFFRYIISFGEVYLF